LHFYHRDKIRSYVQCDHCLLVSVPGEFRLSEQEEKSEYDLHNNNPGDRGYRRFLSRLGKPMLERLPPGQSEGLDFGCGPGPTLSVMMEEAGHQMEIYDPFYFNTPSVLLKKYDFITSTEVVEHIQDLRMAFKQFFHMLKPGGRLGIMTKLVTSKKAFKTWHYTHDLTHISFFSRDTFEYIAKTYDAGLEILGKDVIILQKKLIQ
jgi:2-polyprenyl-3-methyl-5-hydroxy-6-metoxy-1,4-benzoquinol methylase